MPPTVGNLDKGDFGLFFVVKKNTNGPCLDVVTLHNLRGKGRLEPG